MSDMDPTIGLNIVADLLDKMNEQEAIIMVDEDNNDTGVEFGNQVQRDLRQWGRDWAVMSTNLSNAEQRIEYLLKELASLKK